MEVIWWCVGVLCVCLSCWGEANEEWGVLPTTSASLLQMLIWLAFLGKDSGLRIKEKSGLWRWQTVTFSCGWWGSTSLQFCYKAHLSGEVTSCQFAALCSDSSSSTCLVGSKNAQPPPCTAKAVPGSCGTPSLTVVWDSCWLLEVKEKFLAALCCSCCLVPLLETVKMGFAKRQSPGVWTGVITWG